MSCIFSSSFFAPFTFTFQLGSRLKIKYFSLAFICHEDFCQATSGAKTMSKIAITVTNFEMYFSWHYFIETGKYNLWRHTWWTSTRDLLNLRCAVPRAERCLRLHLNHKHCFPGCQAFPATWWADNLHERERLVKSQFFFSFESVLFNQIKKKLCAHGKWLYQSTCQI